MDEVKIGKKDEELKWDAKEGRMEWRKEKNEGNKGRERKWEERNEIYI